jgi:hypothetical protein
MHPPPERRRVLQGLGLAVLLTSGLAQHALAQHVELTTLQLAREDGALKLEFTARLNLPHAVDEALQRGVPLYFVAEATLWRHRWWWRDERVARVRRGWRLAYLPLTGSWRVGFGGLNQSFATQDEALASMTRIAGWKLVDLDQLDPEARYSVEFGYRLDNSQLPGPLQLDLPGMSDWRVGVERTLRVGD